MTTRWAGQALRDLRHAWRTIRAMPGLAAVIVGSLALGIGANTVVFSWIEARLLKPLPGVAGAAQFHWIEPRTDAGLYPGVSWPEYVDLEERLRSFRALLAFRMVPLYIGDTGHVERAYGLLISANYFEALALQPALGRFPSPDEMSRSRTGTVAVISYGLWQKRFAGAPDVVGRTLRVNGRDLAIVGVTPRAFQGTVSALNFEVWIPAPLAPVILEGSKELDDRSIRGYSVMGRLQPSITRAQAQSELDAVMQQLAQAYPSTNGRLGAELLPFTQSPRGPQRLLNRALLILQGVMLLLLLAVCGNTANLVLARASARQREMGIRLALGAKPWRVSSLLLTENILLGLAGAVLGALLAVWGTKALMVVPLTGVPVRFETSLDFGSLAFAMLLGIGCGALFGAAPATQLARVDPQTALRAAIRSGGRTSLRNTLMAAQVALALMVLIVAGLFLRSFMETRDTDPGFRRDGILLAAYDLAGRDTTPAMNRTFAARIVGRLARIPGVEGVAISSSVPLDIHGLPSRVFTVEGHARDDGGFDRALTNTVTPGYFDVMDIPLLAGPGFVELTNVDAPPQAVVNDAFVRRYLTTLEPIGRKLQVRGRTYVIAGVVRTSLYNAFGEPPTPIIYLSYRDSSPSLGEIHLLTRPGTETAIAAQVRQGVTDVDAEVPVFNVRTLSQHVETNLVFRRVPGRMFMVLGPLLLVLAAIGVYAVVAYTVSLRTSEIGVRLALGGTARRLISEFVAQSLRFVAVGAVVGWLIAFTVAIHAAPGSGIDLPVFAGVPLVLLTVATFACWLPARRATRVDPMIALRAE